MQSVRAAQVVERRDTKEVDAALEAWARWAKSALHGVGWPQISLLWRVIKLGVLGAARQVGIRILEIDRTCEIVDSAIKSLGEREREVIARTYLDYDAAPVTAKKCGLSYDNYRNVLSTARSKIRDRLEKAKRVE